MSQWDHVDIVRILVDWGANTTIRNKYGKTAREEASTDEVQAPFEF